MPARPDLPALHLLNSVFAGITGQDLYLAAQLKAGIEQALAETGGKAVAPGAFAQAVADLQARFGGDAARRGFFHWDAGDSPASPDSLWSRQQVLDGLKRLAPYAEATLLITGLREALCPQGRRWTDRRREAYREALAFFDALTAARKRTSAQVTVVVL